MNIGRNVLQSRYACVIEDHESTRTRIGKSEARDHEDLVAEKRFLSLTHCNVAHKPKPTPRALKIPDAKATVDKEWEQLEKLPAWHVTKVKSKKEIIEKAQKREKDSSFCHAHGLVPPQELGVGAEVQKNIKVVLCSEVTLSSATAAKVLDVIARPGSAGQASDAVSAYTHDPKLVKLP